LGHRPRNLPLLLLVTRFRQHENECEQANRRGNAYRLEQNAAAGVQVQRREREGDERERSGAA